MNLPAPAGGPGSARRAQAPSPKAPTDRERIVNRVVVALLDGRRPRGFVYDINTNDPEFHLYSSEDPSDAKSELIDIRRCKAIYFVKSLTGNPNYRENKTELPELRRWGRPFEVVFGDGERIVGTVEIYHEERMGFYLLPPDPKSNNLRIFVIAATVQSITPLDKKTGDGSDGNWEIPVPGRYPADKRNEVVLRLLKGMDVDELSLDVYLPVPVLHFWKRVFVNAGREALEEEALDFMRKQEDPAWVPAKKVDRTPVDKRLEVVMRLFAKEDQAAVSQVFLVPFKLLLEWRERFLEAGKAAIRRQAGDEGSEPPEKVDARYDALLAANSTAEFERDALLNSLSDIFAKEPGKAHGAT
jgi:hypothetical protein